MEQDETCAELSATRIFVAFGAGRTQGRTVVEEDNLAALELEHHPLPLRRVNLTLLLNPKPHDVVRHLVCAHTKRRTGVSWSPLGLIAKW